MYLSFSAERIRHVLILLSMCCYLLLLGWSTTPPAIVDTTNLSDHRCYNSLAVPGVKLKDHTLFQYEDYYYIASINVPLPENDYTKEKNFLYARTTDFCTWELLGTILEPGQPGDPDEFRIWAPHVFHENGTYYMFYTGVNRNIAQTTMLATSTNPADPTSWQRHGAVFRPTHSDTTYPGPNEWSDNRDPMILAHNGRYFMYYTARHHDRGVVALAVAEDLHGPWTDIGAILRAAPGNWPESPYVIHQHDTFYLYYNGSGSDSGQRWHAATTPYGPWRPAVREPVGWAYDFYNDDQTWLASYLLGNGREIQVSPIAWNTNNQPATPRIVQVARLYMPVAIRTPTPAPQPNAPRFCKLKPICTLTTPWLPRFAAAE